MTAHVPCRVCRIWPKVPFVPEGTSSELLQFRNLKMRTKLETAKSSQFHKLINPHQRLFYFEGFLGSRRHQHHHHLVSEGDFAESWALRYLIWKDCGVKKNNKKCCFKNAFFLTVKVMICLLAPWKAPACLTMSFQKYASWNFVQ